MKTARPALATGLLSVVCAGSLFVPVETAAAYQRPGRLDLITVAPDGTPGAGPDSYFGRSPDGHVDVTPDGRFVAFDSRLENLVAGDENAAPDIFVRDRATGATELVSVSGDGEQGAGASHKPSISADGRFVAFDSDAPNLVTGDTNGVVDVFVHDRGTGQTERLPVTSDGAQGNDDSMNPRISADGRLVVFATAATNAVPGDTNTCTEVLVHDRETGLTQHASPAADGGPSDGICTYSSFVDISGDGRFVTFETQMHDLVPNDLNASWDIFVRDLVGGTTERVSVASDGSEGNYVSYNPRISDDGRYVAFTSCASNLVPEDNNSSGPKVTGVTGSNSCMDVFVRDRDTDRTERVSVSSSGREGDYQSFWLDISGDGRFVSFSSQATTLAPGASDSASRVFVHDRQTRQTEIASVSDGGAAFGDSSFLVPPAISQDGRYVAFQTGKHVNLRDRGPAWGIGGLSVVSDGTTAYATGWTGLGGMSVTEATDPADDAAPPEAARLGAELIGAALLYRPEEKDVLARFSLESLPTSSSTLAGSNYVLPGIGGSPGILHTLSFKVDGQRWEVRAIRGNVEEPAYPPPPLIGLWKCDPTCHETLHMSGSYGATGDEIIGRFTLQNVSAAAGAALTEVRATSAVGDALTDDVEVLDEVQLPDAEIQTVEIRLGVAPAGFAESQVEFGTTATLANGSFTGSVSIDGLAPGEYELWAQACLGTVCRAESVPFSR